MGSIWNSTISRRTPLKRSGRPRPFGRRAKRLRASGEVFGPLCDFIRERYRCLGCGSAHVQMAHVAPRGRGYTDWLPNGEGNVDPLCARCHDLADGRVLFHGGRKQFERETGLDLAARAREFGEDFKEWERAA